jgi:hypothetical protein
MESIFQFVCLFLLQRFAKIPEEMKPTISSNFKIYCSEKGFMSKQTLENIVENVIIKNINQRRELLD